MAYGKPLAYCYDKEQEAATTLWTWWKIAGRVTIPSPEGFKKHSSPPSGYNTLQQAAAFLQLQRVSVLTFTFPCGIPSTASLLLMQRHFSQKGALFAISLPPPPPQLQRSPGSPQLPQPTPVPSQLQQPKPTGGQKGDLTSAVPC